MTSSAISCRNENNPKALDAFQRLRAHFEKEAQGFDLSNLFAKSAQRAEKLCLKAGPLFLDYSKNLITSETLDCLVTFAKSQAFAEMRDAMFKGERINNTEDRAVLHTALRGNASDSFTLDGDNIMDDIITMRLKCFDFAEKLRDGEIKGHSGKVIKNIVNIGIGGSDLGPRFITKALKPYHQKDLTFHFVANIDAFELTEALDQSDPEETLFIIASKTFTTLETLKNAETAKAWLTSAFSGDESAIAKHFVAVSTASEKVEAFGIDTQNMFGFWDYVGGRYSSWGSIGLPIMIAIGPQHFTQFLDGAREMDLHFKSAEPAQNMPLILALIGFWYGAFFEAQAQAILPYDQRLELLPSYLQQLDMESNGKSVDRDGKPVTYPTGPVIFGAPGTNGQHAFYQLLHQGTHFIPIDFIGALKPSHAHQDHHDLLLSNMIAQAEALMIGTKGQEGLPSYRQFQGNKPSNMILCDELNPKALGALIALYEHKVFCQGILWNINSFDQWGVELGKKLAQQITDELKSGSIKGHDLSTQRLIQMMKACKVNV